jgi:uncharacterized membrane protein
MRLIHALTHHIRHHLRFYASAVLGLIVYIAMPFLFRRSVPLRTTIAGDIFFSAYLIGMALLLPRSTSSDIRKVARRSNEPLPFIFILTAIATSLSLTDIFTLLHQRSLPLSIRIGRGIFNVVLAWLALHVAATFQYAHLFYSVSESHSDAVITAPEPEHFDTRGLIFPGTEMPVLWDFLYFSFVIGMTAEVSDVQVSKPRMRKLVLLHGIASFFFNTIILALAVNVAAGLSG